MLQSSVYAYIWSLGYYYSAGLVGVERKVYPQLPLC